MNEVINISVIPRDTPKRMRVSLFLIQVIIFHNRVDGIMSFVGIWWGAWTIIFPHFWYSWPVTHAVDMQTFGHPEAISWTLLITGIAGYIGKRLQWRAIRTLSSLFGFLSWCVLTVAFLSVRPIFSPAVACYSAFAIAKLVAYLNSGLGLDKVSITMPCKGDHAS